MSDPNRTLVTHHSPQCRVNTGCCLDLPNFIWSTEGTNCRHELLGNNSLLQLVAAFAALFMGHQLSFDTMRQPLKPEEYLRIFQMDAIELARPENHSYIRLIDPSDANPKAECDHLISERARNSACTATLTLSTYHSGDALVRKRRRTSGADSALFPSVDESGKRVNQGYGGDLSFLPAAQPVICKQSAKFVRHTDDSSGKWEFSSHKIFPLHYTDPAQPAKIVSLQVMDKGKCILCTSAAPHGFKAKKEFTFVSPDKTLTPATLTEVLAQLASGQLQVFFGQTWIVDESKAIFHTMISSCPEPVAPALWPVAMEFQHLAMEMLPSPSRVAGPSRQTSPEPQTSHSQHPDPQTTHVSSLIVGYSTSSDDQQPLLMQQGDLKACGTMTAQNYQLLSDQRLKHEILPLDIDAVDILNKLPIVQYKLIKDPQGQRQIGVVAQDIEKVLADAVHQDSATDMKSVKLDLLQFVTIRALQQFLPLLIKLDKEHRVGLPLLMHAQERAAAQWATNPCRENLSARLQCSTDMSDSDSECETHMSGIGDLDMEHSSDSPGCDSEAPQTSSNSTAPLHFKDDAAMVAHMLAALGEDNVGMPVIVLKLLKKLGRDAAWSAFQKAPFTGLPAADGRARSPGSTFLHLLKKQEQQAKIAQATAQESSRVNGALHGYQQQVLDHVLLNPGQNYIIVAPTASGKTRIPVEAAGALLLRKPTAKVLFLSPTVALTEQQTGVFRASKCITGRVQCISSDNPINAELWPKTVEASTVLVMTAQAFLNMLEGGPATLQSFDLIVFDECHHTQHNHPYNRVAGKYRHLPDLQRDKLQVLGLTATPGSDVSMAATYSMLENLKANLCATFLTIPHDHAEVKQKIGSTEEVVRKVASRPEDSSFALSLGHVLLHHSTSYIVQCNEVADLPLLTEVSKALHEGQSSGRLKGWLTATLAGTPPSQPQLTAHLHLLKGCNTALGLIKDVGFEMALQYLADQCLASQQATAGLGRAATAAGCQGPTAQTVLEEEAASMACAVVADLSEKVCPLPIALAALRTIGLRASISFPKFEELVAVLKELHSRKSASHSMVFVKERQSVHAIVAILRKVPDLTPVRFFAFTGRATTGSRRVAGVTTGSSARSSGMKLTEQKNALRQFKEADGTAVLVATAAAEEGLDIINCEMVVCYTVVETGRELAQRRGRARKAGSVFVNMVEPQDESKLSSACLAESNERVAQKQLSELLL